MRAFVAGPTGAVGTRLVSRLVAAGHTVTGLTRTPARAAALRQQGAEYLVINYTQPFLPKRGKKKGHLIQSINPEVGFGRKSEVRR
jgi:nucleoside-diphosphate-sugar epimerase